MYFIYYLIVYIIIPIVLSLIPSIYFYISGWDKIKEISNLDGSYDSYNKYISLFIFVFILIIYYVIFM